MKTKIVALLGITLMFASMVVNAAQQNALPIRRVLNNSPIQPSIYAQLVASTVKGVSAMQVNNTGNKDLEIAFGASGSETVQMIVPAGLDTAVMPLQAGYATRISVIALDSAADVGNLDVNIFYN